MTFFNVFRFILIRKKKKKKIKETLYKHKINNHT